MEMVERVAAAIREANAGEYTSEAQSLVLARAAITAMRKPTPKMLRAAGAAMSSGKRPTEKRVSERAKHAIRYRAMIDAALSATPQ